MSKAGLPVVAALYLLMLSACTEPSNALEAKRAAARPQTPPAATTGPTIRMSWPGTEDTPGLRGDIVTLTAFEGDTIDLSAILEDADGKGIPGGTLWVASTKGNTVASPIPATDANGRTQVSITAKALGQDVMHVSGAGARKTLTLAVRSPAASANDEVVLPAAEAVSTGPHAPIVRDKAVALRDLPDVTPWKTLAEGVSLRIQDGVYKLRLADQVKRLHGKHVKLQGFMLPLEQEEKQRHFLLTASPPSCFFHPPGGAESIVEVRSERPIAFGFDPIVMSGRLEVIDNHEFGLIYRMTQAQKLDR